MRGRFGTLAMVALAAAVPFAADGSLVTRMPTLSEAIPAARAEGLSSDPAVRATTPASVFPTSGNYRVLLKALIATHETIEDPLRFDGQGDEIYAAAYWATYPLIRGAPTAVGLVKTLVYGDVNQAPTRIRAGTGSGSGGIRSGNVVPDGMAPVAQPSIAAYPDRFPLLVWQGTLQDNGPILVVHPTVWESDGYPGRNFVGWRDWWSAPTGSAILQDKAYLNTDPAKPISQIKLSGRDVSVTYYDLQPGMDTRHGQDRPIGVNYGNLYDPSSTSLNPFGLVLTREKIERALGSWNAILIPIRCVDWQNLTTAANQNGDYTVFVQIERIP